jgi:hypothetical protein
MKTTLTLLTLTLFLTGCSSSRGKVTARADEGHTLLAQSFNNAYIASSRTGEYDVVLVQDPQAKAPATATKKTWKSLLTVGAAPTARPLQPLTANHLKQVVHIHVFWQAQGGSVARDGFITNAAIDWYVIADHESDHPDVLHYEGAGYVLLDPGARGTVVEIRDGSMKKADSATGLTDPLGPANLKGKVRAQRNPQLVRDTLADLKSQLPTTPITAISQSR